METDFCSLKQGILMGYYLYQHVPEQLRHLWKFPMLRIKIFDSDLANLISHLEESENTTKETYKDYKILQMNFIAV